MLTGDDAYVPVDQALPDGATWVDVACEDPLAFETFEAAERTATTSRGGEWQLVVVPGSYIDNDQGLLLGISTADDGCSAAALAQAGGSRPAPPRAGQIAPGEVCRHEG